jgi:hypothetical protein
LGLLLPPYFRDYYYPPILGIIPPPLTNLSTVIDLHLADERKASRGRNRPNNAHTMIEYLSLRGHARPALRTRARFDLTHPGNSKSLGL